MTRGFVLELQDCGRWTVFEVNPTAPAIDPAAMLGWGEDGACDDPLNAPAAVAAAIEARLRSVPTGEV